ncbi:LCI fold-containing protein [Bacillus swezeyi]|uniref:LCI fold-containing protein n=1 Tax=Bacillus swezeyi TaxID=1925020 RepID=UPI0027DD56A0|nr:LCI fold-containing protein [Bacillus swezeyi]
MYGKKILLCSALSLSLLTVGVPSFASTGHVETQSAAIQSDASTQELVDDYVYSRENKFANSFTRNGITWYLKDIKYSNGWYIGHYQANI